MAQFRGKVAWFNKAKGFGFVTREGGPDVFCHFSSIQANGYKALNEGETVEFDVEESPKGLQTANVTALSMASVPQSAKG